MKTKLFFLFLCICLLAPIPKTAAKVIKPDNSVNSQFTVTPAVFEHILQPGQASSQVFQLTNKSKMPLPIKSYVRAFEASDDFGGVDIKEENDIRRLAPTSWVNIETKDFIIQPDSVLKVNVNFNPPRDLPPGGYYAIAFFEPQIPESYIKENKSLQINGRVGALLFLVGAGDIKEKAKISSFNTKKYNWGGDTINFTSTFNNQGNVHLRPSGKLTIKNILPFARGQKFTEVPEITVLPGKTRQWQLTSKNYRWPGIYQAKIDLKYGRDNESLSQEITFYYLPWKYILWSVLIILFIVFISRKKNRLRLKRAIAIIDGKRKMR